MLIALMRMIGVHDGCSDDEIRAYGLLLNREDGGRAFLQMMRSFERTRPFEERTLAALRARAFPAQVIWGAEDPALKLGKFGPEVRDVLRAPDIYTVRGKHFLQEDSPTEIARKIAELSSAA
ncbi:MAG: hypothetical protein H5U40_07665 [Polyangiaceae bacterium]|nr:hypothetical protein [Polyangiaceae bacterium]